MKKRFYTVMPLTFLATITYYLVSLLPGNVQHTSEMLKHMGNTAYAVNDILQIVIILAIVYLYILGIKMIIKNKTILQMIFPVLETVIFTLLFLIYNGIVKHQ